jgi:WD repeat-containing protein mio
MFIIEGPGNPSLQFSTRCVHHLAIDWLDENYIVSCSSSNEAVICVWDRRAGSRFMPASVSTPGPPEAGQQGPALEFKNVIHPKESIWSLRFSKNKRGCLGVLSNTGHFKAYDIAKEYISEEYRNSLDETLGQGSFKVYPEQIYTKYVHDIRSPFNHRTRPCPESERVVAFDFLNISASREPSAISLLGNGKVEIITLQPPCPPTRLSSQGVLACGRPRGNIDFRMKSPSHHGHTKISDAVKRIRNRILPHQTELNSQENGAIQDGTNCLSSRENHERFLSLETLTRGVEVEDALTLTTVNRYRCKEGYLFDSSRNKQILEDNPFLQDLWDWIGRK